MVAATTTIIKPNELFQLELVDLMSHLANALRQISKKSSHPNVLIYQLQLQRAKQKHLDQGQLGDGTEGAVALSAPESENREKGSESESHALDIERQSRCDAAERSNDGIQRRDADEELGRAHGDDARGEAGKGG